MYGMRANSTSLPSIPAKTGPGRKRSGPVPAWGLKLGGALTTLAVFAGSFGYATSNVFVTNAPLKPATVAVATNTSAASTSTTTTSVTTPTTTLTPSVRTTARPAVTRTASS